MKFESKYDRKYIWKQCLHRLFHSLLAQRLPAVRAAQRDRHWGLKNGENSHWSREPIMQLGTRQTPPPPHPPIYIYTNQSQKRDASQFEAMSHTLLTVLLPPGLDCEAV